MAMFQSRNALQSGTTGAFSSIASKDDPLQPLRAMAERVGKEVEKFAEKVDSWHTHGNEDDKGKYQNTLRLVGDFRDYAEAAVKELRVEAGTEHRGELAKSVRRRVLKIADSDLGQSVVQSVEPASAEFSELRQWQAELATWELVRIIIEHYHPAPGTDVAAEKRSRLAKVGGAYRYSPNIEIWNRFLLEDDLAKEKHIVLKWLEQTAENSESDVDTIIEQLEEQAGKDTSTWTSGWLDTRFRIKQEKRLNGTEGPVRPENSFLKKSDRSQPLITQLDPDAPARQKRALEDSDDFYESALWMVCYEMLRRGVPWKEICEWCKERNEAWRGVSIGAAHESQPGDGPNVAGPTIGFLFRRMCANAARGTSGLYEAAIYGLLGGELKSVKAACRNWDDHLYAHYNSLLLSRFDDYLQINHRHRVSPALARKFPSPGIDINNWQTSSATTIQFLKDQSETAAQAVSPIKLIQGALISRSVEELIHHVGVTLFTVLKGDKRPVNLMMDPEAQTDGLHGQTSEPLQTIAEKKHYQTLASDPQALRILVHLIIVLRQGLYLYRSDRHSGWVAMDNVIAAYIEFLRLTRRIAVIPLYAAQLDGERKIHCLARVLPDITNVEEQKHSLDLMSEYEIDTANVVAQNFFVTLQSSGLDTKREQITRFDILEATDLEKEYLWPGQRVQAQFTGLNIQPNEEKLIKSLQWYKHLESDTRNTFAHLTEALKIFLLNGRTGAAIKLVTELSLATLSHIKTRAICGYSFDFRDADADVQNQDEAISLGRSDPDFLVSEILNQHEHASHVLRLRNVSQPYNDLEQLVNLIHLFSSWRDEELVLLAIREEDPLAKPDLSAIRDLFAEIEQRMEQIFTSFLTSSPATGLPFSDLSQLSPEDPLYTRTQADQADFNALKRIYIPELILTYICVIHTFAFLTRREEAVKAMDVANIVASERNKWIQTAFIESGRMGELVDLLAAVSRAMVGMSEVEGKSKGRVGGRKRVEGGRTMKVWDLNVRN
ncbi:hypothetical protein P154DRAFT_528201 [Amniculicola lignicola CBS 123094]|uniref:Nuclear pore complex protein n=1 Tax=Amniculicola lignicola CBS 123094 TaxID=1392246 RepID=A0A6A5VTX1_9PLEO|nr:hypothetical protein P154DRAFT_528201 [Amniculicola lignicola CBS 123094]